MKKRNSIIAVALIGVALFAVLGASVAAAGGLHLQSGASCCGNGAQTPCQYGNCGSGACTTGSCTCQAGQPCGCGCSGPQNCVCLRTGQT
jgi:hypothetical protein